MQEDIATQILQMRPSAVVVETAVTATHGAATGNVFSCDSFRPLGSEPYFARLLCPIAAQLASEQHPGSSALFQVGGLKFCHAA